MITKNNFRTLLESLGFKDTNNVYQKKINGEGIQADIENEKLIYPKGIKIEGDFTTNFSSNENFVVFECVHRLLSLGYKPEHLTLEPKWKLGHGASGGRADIVISDNERKVFAIIECKTAGKEFDDTWSVGLQYPSQLFSYAQQEGSTQLICLYTSNLENDKPQCYYHVIPLVDNKNLLATNADENAATYETATRYDELFLVWKNTYHQEDFTQGFLEDDSLPFQLGKKNYSLNDLKELNHADIQKKYHEFATILRKYNVSGRENAFDKLVNLFLCKVVDEKENPANLKFYWRGMAYDTHFDLQDRLQQLYQQGMKQFLGEDVTYINQEKIDEAFKFLKDDPDATKETINRYFKQLKFFTNNDFAFVDVHNEKLFYHNAVVLLRIVQMLQDIRLKSDSDESSNQFLGDMFEGFLDAGVKQSEGQFFTPMPIVKFIMNSLPLEQLIANSEHPPKAIDYACGSGHFLTELARQIKPLVEKYKKAEIKDYYSNITGIEKEYRLSKVAKVSAFMYGQDDINITYADALARNATIPDGAYNILVANPPYSVKGFLETLTMPDKKSFELYGVSDSKSIITNNAIETYFIERAKQLLAPDGIAAIILPSSILSNDARLYQHARQLLLEHFHIIAIAELGSGTFGKTGTNTVTLFLRRRKTEPAEADHYRNRVTSWIHNTELNLQNKKNKLYDDLHLLESYCQHIGIGFADYKQLWIDEVANQTLQQTEIWQDYAKAFNARTDIKNHVKKPVFKRLTEEQQQAELATMLFRHVREIETEKLYYFLLAHSNAVPVLVIKSPADNKVMKKFLGYEWSAAKGNEGIKYLNSAPEPATDGDDEPVLITAQLNSIQTPLYNPAQKEDTTKLNYYIQQNFTGTAFTLPDNLQEFASTIRLQDMLDFSRKDFNKAISLTVKRVVEINSRWSTEKLGNLVDNIGGLWTGKKPPFVTAKVIRNTNYGRDGKLDLSDVAVIEVETSQFNNRHLQKGDIIIEKSGGSETQAVGRVVYFDMNEQDYSFSNFTARIRVQNDLIQSEYLFLYLNDFYNKGYTFDFQSGSSGLKNLDLPKYLDTKIPVPPPDIQQKIIEECRTVDEAIFKAQQSIAATKKEIENLVEVDIAKTNLTDKDYAKVKLENICLMQAGKFVSPKDINDEPLAGLYPCYGGNGLRGYTKTFTHEGVFSLVGRQGALCGNVKLVNGKFHATEHAIVVTANPSVNAKWLFFHLRAMNLNKYATGVAQPGLSVQNILSISTFIPPVHIQQIHVQEIEILEAQIATAQNIIATAPAQKQAILKKWLE